MSKLDFNCLIAVICGIGTAIPLCILLWKQVRDAVYHRDWPSILGMLMSLMGEAEDYFKNGKDKKQWVMNMIRREAEYANYAIDMGAIEQMIDALCSFAKVVNNKNAEKEKT